MNKERSLIQFLIPILLIIPILMIAGCNDNGRDDGAEVIFTLIFDNIKSRDQDGETVWDAFYSIDEIVPYDMDYMWRDIVISSSLFSSGRTPRDYEGLPSTSGNVGVWYDDWSGNPESADPIDQLVFTSLKEGDEGAWIRVVFDSEIVGTITLPDDFTTG